MATYEKYMNAARNADAAGDEAAARQLVQAAMSARSQTTQEPSGWEHHRRLRARESVHKFRPCISLA